MLRLIYIYRPFLVNLSGKGGGVSRGVDFWYWVGIGIGIGIGIGVRGVAGYLAYHFFSRGLEYLGVFGLI